MQSTRRKLEKELYELIEKAYQQEKKAQATNPTHQHRIRHSELEDFYAATDEFTLIAALEQFKRCPQFNPAYPCAGLYGTSLSQFEKIKKIFLSNPEANQKYRPIWDYYDACKTTVDPVLTDELSQTRNSLYEAIRAKNSNFQSLEDISFSEFSAIQEQFADEKYEKIFDYYYGLLLNKKLPGTTAERNYFYALFEFEKSINDSNREASNELRLAIQNQVNLQNSKQYSLLTEILLSAKEGNNNPSNIENHKKFGKLLDIVTNKLSPRSKLMGGMLIFSGSLFLATAALGVATGIGVNPAALIFAALFFALGVYMIHAGRQYIQAAKQTNKELACPLAQSACTHFYRNLKNHKHEKENLREDLQPQQPATRNSRLSI